MGEEQKLGWEEMVARNRDEFDAGTDFTLAVEEEFALLDTETLELTDRFEDVKAAAGRTDFAEHVVGELIASEVEVRTGRCAEFGEAAATMAERRRQLHGLARELDLGLGGTGTHPWSDWHEQRIIDTPHYRRNDELLRYVVWRNNTFGLHVHVGIRGADRAIAVHDALRNFLPELLALSASSPFVERVNTGLHSARTEVFTRMFPRCGIPDAYGDWQGWEDYVAFLYRTGSITEHTQIWWSVRPHLAYPTVEIRICDGQPDLAEAQSLAALCYELAARWRRTCGGRSAGGSPASCSTSSAANRSPRGRASSSSSTGSRRSPTRSGRRRSSTCPSRTRPSGRSPGSRRVRASARSTPSRSGRVSPLADGPAMPAPDEDLAALQEQLLALDVSQFVVSAASTLASLAFGKLQRGELDQAKRAIDALQSLLPHVEDGIRADLQRALTELQVAFASASS
jgi:carboxylate-amine ligase